MATMDVLAWWYSPTTNDFCACFVDFFHHALNEITRNKSMDFITKKRNSIRYFFCIVEIIALLKEF